MRAIVLIDHGSRLAAANEQLEELARLVRDRRPDDLVRIAHLEIAPPPLGETLDTCVEAGADEIVVLPYFLSPGRHSTRDIPRLVEEARERHPGVTIRQSEPLGVHPLLVDLVLERIDER